MNAHAMNVVPMMPAAVPASGILAARAMLASLSIKAWSARKVDRKATDSVLSENDARPDAGRFNKSLVARDALASITQAATRARTLHYARTLPWQDDGARILSAAGFDSYCQEMRKIREEWQAAVAEFVANYPAYIAAAESELGKLYNPLDYPDPADVARLFDFRNRFNPVPAASDFRVDMSEAQAANIRAEIQAASEESLKYAMADVWQRIAEHVGTMAGKLAAYKPASGNDKATGIFRDSLVENVRELVDLLPSLNLTGDSKLAAIADRMRRDLCGSDAKQLRESDSIRSNVAQAAESILADVSAYMA